MTDKTREGRAVDPRPARTRAAIYAAVESLSRGSEPVTVNAISKKANVGRTSFYAQFASLDDLAIAMLVDTFHEIGADDVVDRRSRDADARNIARRAAARLIEHIADRRSFYAASLDWRVTSQVQEALAAAFGDQVRVSMDVMGDRVPAQLNADDAARYIGGGAIALVVGWLRDPNPAPAAEMSERLLAVMPDWLVGQSPQLDPGTRLRSSHPNKEPNKERESHG